MRSINYWVDEKAGKVFGLVDAPDAEAAHTVYREAHALVADERSIRSSRANRQRPIQAR